MRTIRCSLFLIVFMASTSMIYSINYNELKMLRFLAGRSVSERIVLRQVDHYGEIDSELLAELERLRKERDEARELLGELADFAEDNK